MSGEARTGQLSRMLYLDDSGSDRHGGLIVYGWVEVEPAFWSRSLRQWLEMRKLLVRDHAVPVTQELHATQYINGRSRISTNPPPQFEKDGEVLWKDLGRSVALRCLEVIRGCEHLQVGAVYRWEPAGGKAYGQAKYETYRDFIADLDDELRVANTYGHVTMDGDDPHYREAHRLLKLDSRHLIEDPVAHDSRVSQWTQIADLVAYTANIHLNRYRGNQFGWDWYSTYLAPRDPHGAPREQRRRYS
ncbi:DUF3800 domain-containing protein [Nocardiopsis dassonvillei]|uniref:DUF3800 domain-containing protein n=1 Tax=Nocardiopsis dassonvillei TaxID=2014 RepID=UPI00366C2878